MESRRCAACGQAFRPRSQVPHQSYCSAAACQRARRQRWRNAKRESDADYRANQARAQRAWARGHREYWREYRRTHPEYGESNRKAAREWQRDRRQRAAGTFANTDVSKPLLPISTGTYRLVRAAAGEFANMDASIVEITLLSMPYGARNCRAGQQ
jgi:hypothetical protein